MLLRKALEKAVISQIDRPEKNKSELNLSVWLALINEQLSPEFFSNCLSEIENLMNDNNYQKALNHILDLEYTLQTTKDIDQPTVDKRIYTSLLVIKTLCFFELGEVREIQQELDRLILILASYEISSKPLLIDKSARKMVTLIKLCMYRDYYDLAFDLHRILFTSNQYSGLDESNVVYLECILGIKKQSKKESLLENLFILCKLDFERVFYFDHLCEFIGGKYNLDLEFFYKIWLIVKVDVLNTDDKEIRESILLYVFSNLVDLAKFEEAYEILIILDNSKLKQDPIHYVEFARVHYFKKNKLVSLQCLYIAIYQINTLTGSMSSKKMTSIKEFQRLKVLHAKIESIIQNVIQGLDFYGNNEDEDGLGDVERVPGGPNKTF